MAEMGRQRAQGFVEAYPTAFPLDSVGFRQG